MSQLVWHCPGFSVLLCPLHALITWEAWQSYMAYSVPTEASPRSVAPGILSSPF